MQAHQERRLVPMAELIAILQLEESEVRHLVDTAQIRPIQICGHERFDTKDVFQLVDSYHAVQNRRIQ
jgi:hypothetical protein